ncbi:MAG: hypothetical protein IKE23_12025 [Exiguobacterium sp.]|nr:hypothetical protein [Exiguobacterium sp.]
MNEYKNSNHAYNEGYALPHIKANRIRCRYYKWIGMVGNTDILKIDGKIRQFDIKTHREKKDGGENGIQVSV